MEEKKLQDFLPDKNSSYLKEFNNSNTTSKINKEQVIIKLKCGHFYHYDCIQPWVEADNSCPLCRKAILKRMEDIF